MKKLISIVLVFLLVALSWFPVLVFKHQQKIVRKEMKKVIKNGVPEHQHVHFYLDELQLNKVHLQWMHENEFRFKGEMYDIISRDTCDGRLKLICIHDVKESGLFAQLDKLIDQNMTSNAPMQSQRKLLHQLIQSLFFEHNEKQSNDYFISDYYSHYLQKRIVNPFFKPESPPPEV